MADSVERAPLPPHLEKALATYRLELAAKDAQNPSLQLEQPETAPESTLASLVQSGAYPTMRAARLDFEHQKVVAASDRRNAGVADYNARQPLLSRQLRSS